jgi:hypothetical protein
MREMKINKQISSKRKRRPMGIVIFDRPVAPSSATTKNFHHVLGLTGKSWAHIGKKYQITGRHPEWGWGIGLASNNLVILFYCTAYIQEVFDFNSPLFGRKYFFCLLVKKRSLPPIDNIE